MTGENNKSIQKLMDSELESVNGGNLIGDGIGGYGACSHKQLDGVRFKKKSLFGWNWYERCVACGEEVQVERGPWSGDPD